MVRHNGMILQRGPQEGTNGKTEVIGVLLGDNTPELRGKATDLVKSYHLTHFNKELEPIWTSGDRGLEVIPPLHSGFRVEKIRYFLVGVGVWA